MSDAIAPIPAESPAEPAWRRWLAPAFSVLVFALVVWVLHHALGRYHLRDIVAQLRAIPRRAVLAAAVLTAGSYSVLTCTTGSACSTSASGSAMRARR